VLFSLPEIKKKQQAPFILLPDRKISPFVEMIDIKGRDNMKEFQVVFHFDKENSKEIYIQGASKETVLEEVQNSGDSYLHKEKIGVHRINMNLVTWISVYPSN
jgi:antibiotic biosynthesis monooxygenase (ABM) superfamily enzyme